MIPPTALPTSPRIRSSNQKRNIATIKEAARIAESFGEKLAIEGEICWGGMHGWKSLLELLEGVGHPKTVGIQADMAHTLLFMLGYNAEEDAPGTRGIQLGEGRVRQGATRPSPTSCAPGSRISTSPRTTRPSFGSGSHDKTGRHCPVDDTNGKLDIPYHAGFWLRDDNRQHIDIKHMCWDGCMFPNAVMEQPETWNKILAAMNAVREKHGWN